MKKFMAFLRLEMAQPPAFGTFHLVAFALTLLTTIALCFFCHDVDDATYRRILFVIWIVMVVMEALKQFSKCYVISDDGSIVWGYDWTTFPFQLCDGPLYLLLPIALMPDGKVRNALSLYSATYIVLGGLSTYILISTTFGNVAYWNVQTLAHHGLQIVSGVFIGIHNRKNWTDWKNFSSAVVVFLPAVVIATTLNIVLHYLVPGQEINMFFISPFFKKTMPIWNEAWHKLHWTINIAIYVFGVTIIAFGVYMIYQLFFRLARKKELQEQN